MGGCWKLVYLGVFVGQREWGLEFGAHQRPKPQVKAVLLWTRTLESSFPKWWHRLVTSWTRKFSTLGPELAIAFRCLELFLKVFSKDISIKYYKSYLVTRQYSETKGDTLGLQKREWSNTGGKTTHLFISEIKCVFEKSQHWTGSYYKLTLKHWKITQ